jgi:hypothetical protein
MNYESFGEKKNFRELQRGVRALRRDVIRLDAIAVIQFLPCGTFTETLWAIKWLAVVTFAFTSRAVCDNDIGPN